jgi:hypothetical protein
VDEVLGVLALAGYIVAIVSLAAGVTYTVIRIFPTERKPKDGEAAGESKPAKAAETKAPGDAPAGNLFRRSKRDRG